MNEPVLYMPELGSIQLVQFDREGDGGVVSLAAKDEAAAAMRKELIERSTKGEHIELLVDAVTYAQGEGIDNSRYVRFSSKALTALAKLAAGTPLCRNHSLDTDDVIGVSMGAKVVKGQGDIRELLEQLIANTPVSVQGVLRGAMRKFSIQWRTPLADISCTYCKKPYLECEHWPGKEVVGKGGAPEIVWMEYGSVNRFIERSWVVNPAVLETYASTWTQQLSADRRAFQETSRGQKMESIITILKMDSGADEATVARRVASLMTERDAAVTKLDALTAKHEDTITELAGARAELAEAAKLKAEIAELRAAQATTECETKLSELLTAHKILPGGKQEARIRKLYADGQLDAARAYVEEMGENAPRVPIGRQSSGDGETKAGDAHDKGEPDYTALCAGLPVSVREACADRIKADPEKFLRRNKERLSKYIDLSFL